MVDQDQETSKQEDEDLQPSSQQDDDQEELEGESAASQPKQILIMDEELKAMQEEAIEYKDKYLRLLADSENARKRLQKERQDMMRHASEKLIVDFLRPLDNFENALHFAQGMSDEVKNWMIGFQMIFTQFKDILNQNGVIPIDSLGKPFNPYDHEAVEMIESTTQPSGTIVEECMKGYRMGERTIRAARVKVAKNKNDQSEISQE